MGIIRSKKVGTFTRAVPEKRDIKLDTKTTALHLRPPNKTPDKKRASFVSKLNENKLMQITTNVKGKRGRKNIVFGDVYVILLKCLAI